MSRGWVSIDRLSLLGGVLILCEISAQCDFKAINIHLFGPNLGSESLFRAQERPTDGCSPSSFSSLPGPASRLSALPAQSLMAGSGAELERVLRAPTQGLAGPHTYTLGLTIRVRQLRTRVASPPRVRPAC